MVGAGMPAGVDDADLLVKVGPGIAAVGVADGADGIADLDDQAGGDEERVKVPASPHDRVPEGVIPRI